MKAERVRNKGLIKSIRFVRAFFVMARQKSTNKAVRIIISRSLANKRGDQFCKIVMF